MKKNIHPKYVLAMVTCACGASFKVRSTKREYRLEICSKCHPYFTGQQKFVDTAGRVEKFRQRYQKQKAVAEPVPAETAPVSELLHIPESQTTGPIV